MRRGSTASPGMPESFTGIRSLPKSVSNGPGRRTVLFPGPYGHGGLSMGVRETAPEGHAVPSRASGAYALRAGRLHRRVPHGCGAGFAPRPSDRFRGVLPRAENALGPRGQGGGSQGIDAAAVRRRRPFPGSMDPPAPGRPDRTGLPAEIGLGADTHVPDAQPSNREYGYLKRWYAGSTDCRFEGFSFPGVSDPDEYLRFKFGEYMVPPPEDQRKTHPVSALQLIEPALPEAPDV